MYVSEFTLHAKPGQFEQLAETYSAFAREFLSMQPQLESVLILGDEAQGIVRGIGVFEEEAAADAVNSDPVFAAFNEAAEPLLAKPPERVELKLLHTFVKA
jgi:quinol monooxygenase YgiN